MCERHVKTEKVKQFITAFVAISRKKRGTLWRVEGACTSACTLNIQGREDTCGLYRIRSVMLTF